MITAVVPIKELSSRVKGKNFKLISGKPLFYWIINTLLNCNDNIDRIIVNIDSDNTKKLILEHFTDDRICFYTRPNTLRGGDVSTNLLLLDMLSDHDDNDIILQTHVTNPLLKEKTINDAIATYYLEGETVDSLFSVTSHHTRLYDDNNKEVNHDRFNLIPTQNLAPIHEENSCFYIFNVGNLRKYKSRIGINPYLYAIGNIEATDIDWEHDFAMAKILLDMKLNANKVVLVTGANGGIGSDICLFFKEKGWHVIATDIGTDPVPLVDQYIQADLCKSDNIKNLRNQIKSNKIDCMVNCAALQKCYKIQDTSMEDWDSVINCNLRAPYLLCKSCLPLMPAGSCIVNIGSVHSVATSATIASYSISKAGITGLTRSMAIDLSPLGIRVNCISPGAIETPMLIAGLERNGKTLDDLNRSHLLGHVGKPRNIAKMIYDIYGNDFINGANILIDGGASIKLSTE